MIIDKLIHWWKGDTNEGGSMKIIKIPISKIKEAPYNPRKDLKPSDEEYQRLKKSIQEFDLVEPLIWNERSGNLVGGHQRFKIIKNEMGLTEVDVSVVNLDEQKEMALNIALNKISGEWDIPKLKDLLVGLDSGAFDLSLTGFDEPELKKLIDWEGESIAPLKEHHSTEDKIKCPECGHEFSKVAGKKSLELAGQAVRV